MRGEFTGDPGQRHWGRFAVIGAGGLAVAAAAALGRGHASAVTIGALGGAIALAAVDRAAGNRATDDAAETGLRLAMAEGRIERNEERIGRVLSVLEAHALA